MKFELCGAFYMVVSLRDGETPEQAAERAEETLQKIVDKHAKRLDVRIGVDYSEIKPKA